MRYGSEWKRLAGLALVLSMVFGLTACAATEESPEETTAVQTEGPKTARMMFFPGERGVPSYTSWFPSVQTFSLPT